MGSSQDLFPMFGGKHGDSRSPFYGGRNRSTITSSSHDSLGKFRGIDSPFAWFSADSPTTTLSIGSDLPGEEKASEEQVQKTILRLKTWSTASDGVMQDAAIDHVVGSGLEDIDDENSKGVKRKRSSKGQREGIESASGEDSGVDGEDSEGIVLYWGSTGKRDYGIEDLTPNGAITASAVAEFGISRDVECNSPAPVNQQGSREARDNMTASSGDPAFGFNGAGLGHNDDQGTLLQLGQTLGVSPQLLSEGRAREARSNMSTVGEGVHLGLAPAGNVNEMHTYETTLDGVPVIDEGSSSARMSKTGGGFMPALLLGNSMNLSSPREQIIHQHQQQQQSAAAVSRGHLVSFGPELGNYGECGDQQQGVEQQDLSMTFRTSSSGGTTSTSGTTSGISDRVNKVCKFRGCSKGARGASGLCIAHGGGQRCEKNGCNKGAEGRTVYCKAHGGGRRCQNLGCTKSAEGKTDYCIGHGGGRRCSHDGCDKAARGRSGLCIRHGGGKRCLREGCTKSAEGYSGLCISHGGGRRCHFAGCSKGAQGSTMFCKAHGGGKRCMIQGCNKGAEGSTPLCKGHGGGKRCMFDGGGICTKSVHGGTLYCVAHGGGKRCQVEGCSKSARGRTDFCVRHGGGKRCKVDGCGKSAQGSTDFCKAHGGGRRCQWGVEGSGFGEPGKGEVCDKFARGKTGLCAAHSAQVQDRRVHGATGIGPGLTPGLFRGLVNGSGQSRLGIGSPSSGTQGMFVGSSYGSPGSSVNSMKDDSNGIGGGGGLPGQLLSSSLSSRSGQGLSASPSNMNLSGLISVDGLSGSSVHGGNRLMGTVTPAFPSNFTIGQPLIPPQVLVPLSMQTKDTANKLINGRPPRPPTGAEGGLSIASRSPGSNVGGRGGGGAEEDRVHGGGLMALLSRDGNNFAGGFGGISLGIATSSPAMNGSRWPNAVAGHTDTNSPRTEEDTQKQKQLNSLGTDDVGQFLAIRS